MEIEISVCGEDINLTDDNCNLFRFRKLHQMDHIYYKEDGREFYIFDCEPLFQLVEDREGIVVLANWPSDDDENAYVSYIADHIDEEWGSL